MGCEGEGCLTWPPGGRGGLSLNSAKEEEESWRRKNMGFSMEVEAPERGGQSSWGSGDNSELVIKPSGSRAY